MVVWAGDEDVLCWMASNPKMLNSVKPWEKTRKPKLSL